MLSWLIEVNRLLREMRKKALSAKQALEEAEVAQAKTINGYLLADYVQLIRTWKAKGFPEADMGSLPRHIRFGDEHDYQDMLTSDIPLIEEKADKYAAANAHVAPPLAFDDLLDPAVRKSSTKLFQDGHLREAVVNAIIAVFDLIRKRTQLSTDGDRLIGEVFSVKQPHLTISELTTESGQNDQAGFILMCQGLYKGVRNPNSHTLEHQLDEKIAAQYLVFASLLARRIRDATSTK